MECDAKGAGARPDLCRSLSIRAYPTWIIGTQRHEGLLTLDELAKLSGFDPATVPATR